MVVAHHISANNNMTTCEYDGTEQTYNCMRYEQCDECYAKDNPEETVSQLEVQGDIAAEREAEDKDY